MRHRGRTSHGTSSLCVVGGKRGEAKTAPLQIVLSPKNSPGPLKILLKNDDIPTGNTIQRFAAEGSGEGMKTDLSSNLPPDTEKCADRAFTDGLREIVLSPEHALCRLRTLWNGKAPETGLQLGAFPEGSVAEEAERQALEQDLTRFADARWRQVLTAAASAELNLDEEVFFHLSRDGMLAWLLLVPPVGTGQAHSAMQLLKCIAHEGICAGVDWRTLKVLPSDPERYFRLILIARGQPPVPGEDSRVVDFYPRKQRTPAPVKELGREDYVTLNMVQKIKKGAEICRILPAGKGIPGTTVTGQRVPARDGRAVDVPQGRNTVLSEDGAHLLSARDGHLEFNGRCFQVKPVLELMESVDHADSDIKFLGDIHIHGDVCSGATIRAMGNIQIDGVIEGCTIEAGENLVVSSGVQGQDCAVVRAQKSIYAKYLEHCSVYARESVQADCIIDSQVYSDGPVLVCTGRGAIVGGTIRSSQEVVAVTVGSKAERPTAIVLDAMPCENFERTQILAELEKTQAQMEEESAKKDDPERQKKLSKLNLNLCVIKMKLEKQTGRSRPSLPEQRMGRAAA